MGMKIAEMFLKIDIRGQIMTPEHQHLYDKVNALLQAHAVNGHARYIMAPFVAQKSLEMNHLYEAIGFRSRTQMARFMKRNFPTLAAKKPKDKLWKKFLYDSVDEIAPYCATCDDQLTCFTCMVKEMAAA